ncbi:hypothetical protein HYX58_00410 [Candidatus Dependentiae bacterium]|nr:hypothetical protein [Candidatus Dependentiae bacterium]
MKRTIFLVGMVFSFLFPSVVYCLQLDDAEKKKIDVELLCWAQGYRKAPTALFIQIPIIGTFEELKVFIAHKIGVIKANEITVNCENEKIDNPKLIDCLGLWALREKDSIKVVKGIRTVDLTKLPKIHVYSKN